MIPLLGFLPEMHYTGTYAPTGNVLSFDVELCEADFATQLRTQNVRYTATEFGLTIISEQGTGTVVITYVRQ